METHKFIEKAKNIHGEKYDYSKVEYVNTDSKVCIICPEHGEFWQTPHSHLSGSGCPVCSKEKRDNKNRKTLEQFIEESNKIHKGKYNYSKVIYKNNKTKVCIICPEHGEFWMFPNNHLSQKQGCPICGGRIKKTNEEFIRDSKKAHGDKYDYSLVNYKNNRTNIILVCPKHGEFQVHPDNHLAGNGCPKCAGKHRTTDEAIEDFKKVHGNKYDYSKVKYINATTPVEIICPKHGSFRQLYSIHMYGCGCPVCGTSISEKENEIYNYIKNVLNISDVKKRVHGILETSKSELDIFIPSKKLAIEYDGLIWHSEKFGKDPKYHLLKTEECKKKGIRLIHIFEDEYLEHKEIVLEKIKNILGCSKTSVVGARKCKIEEINWGDANTFLTKFHIQGGAPSTIYLGSFYDGKLMGVMTFKKEKENMWELNRFATNTNYSLPGLANKMFNAFIRKYQPCAVKSFLDRRWNCEGNTVYEKMGFLVEKIERPDYSYTNGKKRYHKFLFRKQILNKKYNFPLTMTENEMTKKLGYYKVWNCGLTKYMWKKNED